MPCCRARPSVLEAIGLSIIRLPVVKGLVRGCIEADFLHENIHLAVQVQAVQDAYLFAPLLITLEILQIVDKPFGKLS